MPHGQHILGQQFGGMTGHNRHAQNGVLAGHRQHGHEALRVPINNGAVQIVEVVAGHLERHLLRLCLLLVEADAGHLRDDKGCLRNHGIISLEQLEFAKQRIDCRIPGLVRRHMRELKRTGHIARCVNIGVHRLQIRVGVHGAVGRNAQLVQTIPRQAGAAAHSAQQLVKFNARFTARVRHQQRLHAAIHVAAQRLVPGQYRHAVARQRSAHQR